MEYQVRTGDAAAQRCHTLVLGVFRKRKLPEQTAGIDETSGGALSRLLKTGDMDGEKGRTVVLYSVSGVAAQRIMLVGLGPATDFTPAVLRDALEASLRQVASSGARDALLALPLAEADTGLYDVARDIAITAGTAVYRFDELKSRPDAPTHPLKRIGVMATDASDARTLRKGLEHGRAISAGMDVARDLANLPGNICTPTYLADQARRLSRGVKKMRVQVLDEKAMEKLGMGALLSVSRGSRQPASLICLEYRGGKPREKPVALVGKGLTFDAGGISLKPAAEMDEMKYDMCGGASVLGALKACAQLELPINVVGLVPASENLPDGDANKPGDIVTSMSGQTIEILNTDAEGRLILCDTLTYAERFKPAAVVDIATLTGACIVALGHHASGLLATDDGLADALTAAGQRTGDRAWRLPLWADYQSQLDSNFADMANIGGRSAGAITAACFLARFAKKFKWAHLDIAGTAWKSGKEKGATGRPVPMLVQFLLDRARVSG
jgi:leucyl aminopeptidase